MKVGSSFYVVVGVLSERMPTGGTGGSQAAEDYNQDVYIPLRTCRARFGERIYIRQSGSRSGSAGRAPVATSFASARCKAT